MKENLKFPQIFCFFPFSAFPFPPFREGQTLIEISAQLDLCTDLGTQLFWGFGFGFGSIDPDNQKNFQKSKTGFLIFVKKNSSKIMILGRFLLKV